MCKHFATSLADFTVQTFLVMNESYAIEGESQVLRRNSMIVMLRLKCAKCTMPCVGMHT